MNVKGYALVLVLAIAIAGGVWFSFRGRGQEAAVLVSQPVSTTTPAVSPLEHPTIELLGGMHATATPTGGKSVALRTGDTVQAVSTISIGNDTKAVIRFPDGSQARLASGSSLQLTEASYRPDVATLAVTMRLDTGRVWSKILDLATPASHWEVTTSNAVATVRGTAFDVKVAGKQTSIFTASRKVAVNLLDPVTQQPLLATTTDLKEGKLLLIGEREIAQAQAKRLLKLSLLDAPSNYTKDSWITANTQADATFDAKLQQLQEQGVPREKVREQLRQMSPTIEEVTPSTAPVASKPAPAPVLKPTVVSAKPVGLDVRPATVTGEVTEGKTLVFRASLRRSDGTNEDVSTSVRWQVIGPIGRFSSPGNFIAELDPAAAETGEGSGTIVAVYKDPVSGEEYLAKTAIFRVVGAVDAGGAAI